MTVLGRRNVKSRAVAKDGMNDNNAVAESQGLPIGFCLLWPLEWFTLRYLPTSIILPAKVFTPHNTFTTCLFQSCPAPMDFASAVLKRRMIRKFKPTPVPEESQNRILDLMHHYPSAGFSQGGAFIVVTDPIVQKRLENSSWPYEAQLMIVQFGTEKLYHDRNRYTANPR